MNVNLFHADNLEVLKTLDDNSVDSIVTDPPYGLSFMGKKWDYDVPSQELWEECLRVLKPGDHLLAFAGTRTQHRMAERDVIGVRSSFRPNANATRDPEGFQDRSSGAITAPATDAARQWQGWGTARHRRSEGRCGMSALDWLELTSQALKLLGVLASTVLAVSSLISWNRGDKTKATYLIAWAILMGTP